MNLILIGMDASAFRNGSYFRKRLADYAKGCESIAALIVTNDADAKALLEGNLKIMPIRSAWKPFVPFKLVSAGRREGHRFFGDATQRGCIVYTAQDPFFLGLAAWLAARMSHARLHLQIHVEFFSPFYRRESWKNKIHYRLARFLLPRADRIRAVSKKIGGYCEKELHIPKEKIDVIPLLIDVGKITRTANGNDDLGSKKFSKTILMACRLSKQKNIPLALHALTHLSKDVGLVIVGKGEEEGSTRGFVSALGLQDRVELLPWSDDVPSLMRAADVFLISSDYEGYVMTAMEASACGLPVVMTDVGGAGEFVEDGENGLVVPVGDEKALAAALEKALNDEPLRQKLTAGARKKTAALPSYESYVHDIVASWQKTCEFFS